MDVYQAAAQFVNGGGTAIVVDTEWRQLYSEPEIWRYIFFSLGVAEWYGYDPVSVLRHHFSVAPPGSRYLVAIVASVNNGAAQRVAQTLQVHCPRETTKVVLAAPVAQPGRSRI